MSLAEWLYTRLRPEEYLDLLARFGKQRHYIPSVCGCPCLRAERDAQVAAEWRLGVPVAELARRHQLTTRQVQRVLRQPRRPTIENDMLGAEMSQGVTDLDSADGPAERRPYDEEF